MVLNTVFTNYDEILKINFPINSGFYYNSLIYPLSLVY